MPIFDLIFLRESMSLNSFPQKELGVRLKSRIRLKMSVSKKNLQIIGFVISKNKAIFETRIFLTNYNKGYKFSNSIE